MRYARLHDQRFEYCTDLLWKLIKIELEEVEKIKLALASPRGIIREAVVVKIISEQQAHDCMEMIKSRNQTSHIYHEEIAVDIAHKVPDFYTLMKTVVTTIQEKIS